MTLEIERDSKKKSAEGIVIDVQGDLVKLHLSCSSFFRMLNSKESLLNSQHPLRLNPAIVFSSSNQL
jgi:hypothetical protein